MHTYLSIVFFLGELEGDWNEQLSIFFSHSDLELEKFSCSNRCGLDERNAETIAKLHSSQSVQCFCDKLCVEFGDCCFDFSRR